MISIAILSLFLSVLRDKPVTSQPVASQPSITQCDKGWHWNYGNEDEPARCQIDTVTLPPPPPPPVIPTEELLAPDTEMERLSVEVGMSVCQNLPGQSVWIRRPNHWNSIACADLRVAFDKVALDRKEASDKR